MRESIGATYIFTICLTFIIIFTGYLAISVNYAKAFKIKSYIISEIEENDGYDSNIGNDIETYLTAQGYSAYGKCPNYISVEGYTTDWRKIDCLGNAPSGHCGVCIYEMEALPNNASFRIDDMDMPRSFYRAVTFFKFDLPVVNTLLTFKVSGETKYIYDER